jgi:hypothetical protein
VRLVALLYGLNFAVSLWAPEPRALFVFGWLLMALGFWAMSLVPAQVFERPFERKFRDARWVVGHGTLMIAVTCLVADLLQRKLFP